MTISAVNGVEPTISLTSQVSPATKASPLPSLVEKPFYFSPTLTVDPKTGTAVLEIRNSETGKVTAQYPNQNDVQAYEPRSLKPEQTATAGASATATVGQAAATGTGATAAATASVSAGVVAAATAATTATIPGNSIVI
jgi:hypothetical protein